MASVKLARWPLASLTNGNADLERIGLEPGGVLDQARTLGQQTDHLVVDAVDAGAHGGQVGGEAGEGAGHDATEEGSTGFADLLPGGKVAGESVKHLLGGAAAEAVELDELVGAAADLGFEAAGKVFHGLLLGRGG